VEPAQASTAPATPEVKEEPPALTVTLPPETPPVAPAVESLASSASPRDPRLVQAEQLFRAGDYERVLAIENRPPQSGSPDFLQQQETYLQLEEFRGCAHMARGSMDSAAEIFRRILQQSRRGLAQYNLLVCCHHLGLYQEVVEHAYPDLIRAKSTLPSARLKEVLLKAEFFHAFAHYKLCQEAEMQTRAPACRRAKDELEDYVRRWASEQSLPEAQTYVGSAQYHLDDLISHSQ